MPRPLNYAPSGCREIFTPHHTAQIPIGFFSCSLPNRSIAERDAWAFFLTKLFTTLPRSSYLSVAETNAEKSFGVLVNFFTSFPSASLQLKRKKKWKETLRAKTKKAAQVFQPSKTWPASAAVRFFQGLRRKDDESRWASFFLPAFLQGWLRGCFKPWS